MINLFLPNENTGFFGSIAHWCFMGFLASFLMGLPTLALFSLLFSGCGVLLMCLFD
jgi:hypothetical protein